MGLMRSVEGTQRSVGSEMLLLLSMWTAWLISAYDALNEKSSVKRARTLTRGSSEWYHVPAVS